MLEAVLLDVDFTLFRPGPELGPLGYQRIGARHGLTLDPERHASARDAALAELQRHPELVHDDEIWIRFTEAIVVGMGGDPVLARACAVDLVDQWERHENFFLYEDALPALALLREHGLRIGLVSNGQRDLDEFARSLLTVGTRNTLPLEIYGMTTNITSPALYALGTVTTVFSFVVILGALAAVTIVQRRRERRAPAKR